MGEQIVLTTSVTGPPLPFFFFSTELGNWYISALKRTSRKKVTNTSCITHKPWPGKQRVAITLRNSTSQPEQGYSYKATWVAGCWQHWILSRMNTSEMIRSSSPKLLPKTVRDFPGTQDPLQESLEVKLKPKYILAVQRSLSLRRSGFPFLQEVLDLWSCWGLWEIHVSCKNTT